MEESKNKMSDWCRALRMDEAHLAWMTNNETRGKQLVKIERDFNCYWEDKFKEVCESYNQETAANAIGLDIATFRNWAKHLNLRPYYKEVDHHQSDKSPYNYFVEEDVKESMGLNPNITERRLLLYIQKNPKALKVSDPAKQKEKGKEIKKKFLEC
jgi:hypothetical protein